MSKPSAPLEIHISAANIEGDDVHCRIQLEALIASLVSHKHPELKISFPTATMTTSRSA